MFNLLDKVVVFRKKLWFCMLCTLLLFLLYFLLMRPVFETNDDFNIALFVNLGRPVQDAHWLFPNWLLGSVCAFLYRLTNMLPWYGLMQYFGLYCSFVAIMWGIQRRFRPNASLILTLILFNFFAVDASIKMQFTKTAGICAACGLFVVVLSIIEERICWIALIAGMMITAYGFMYRHLEADIMFALWAVFGIYLLLDLWKRKLSQMRKRAVRYILIFILTFACCYSCRMIDRYEYHNNPDAEGYERINDARSQLTDYGFPRYEDQKELFESLGITYTAYKLFSRWNFYDPDVFTLDKMEKLIKIQNRKQFNIELLKDFLDVYPYKWFQNPMFYCFLTMLVFALIHKAKGWQGYAAILMLLATLFMLFLYFFKEGRFNLERTENPIWLCGCLILLYLISPSGFDMPRKYAWTVVLILLCLNQNNWKATWRHNTVQDAEKMKVSQNFISQVSSDTEHLYLTKTGLYAVSPAYGPLSLVPVGAASNMAVLGGWPSGSIPYKTTLRKYGIENPYRDCVNNEKVLLIDNDINTTINYIHEYYDMDARAEEAGMFDEENKMYRIVSG